MKHLTRRHALLGAIVLLPLGLAACPGTSVTPANVAAAIAALNGVIASTQALIVQGGLTGGNLLAAQQAVAALQAQVTALTASTSTNAQSTIATVFDTVTAILGQMAQYLPLITGVLGIFGMAKPDTPDQAALRMHLATLKSLAGR